MSFLFDASLKLVMIMMHICTKCEWDSHNNIVGHGPEKDRSNPPKYGTIKLNYKLERMRLNYVILLKIRVTKLQYTVENCPKGQSAQRKLL